jgi:hypothetical protein
MTIALCQKEETRKKKMVEFKDREISLKIKNEEEKRI